jgi:hypothetical protein
MIKPYGDGRMSDRLLMANDKKKLWIFAILFITVLACFLGVQIWGNLEARKKAEEQPTEGRPISDDVPIDVAPKRDDTGRISFAGEPQTVQDRRELAENDLGLELSKLAESGDLVDGREEDSPKVLDLLLQRVLWEYQVTTLPEHVYRRLPTGQAGHDPAPYRGRLTSAFGKLLEKGPMEAYPTDVEQVKEIQRAVFVTAEGDLFHVTTTLPIERNVGEWVQVYGVFFRNRPVTVDGKEQAAFGLVLSKKPDIAYPPVTVTSIDPEWADEILDASYDQASRLEERPFWLLMNYAKNLNPEEYGEKKAKGEVEVIDFGTKARPLVRRADEYRLEHVSAIGKIITPITEYLDHDNPGKVEQMYSAILLQPSGYFVRLVAARHWDDYDIRVGNDFVRVEGVFVKRWQYIPEEGNVPLEIPLVVVTDIELVDKVGAATVNVLRWVFLAVAILVVVLFVWVALKNQKARSAFRERVREKTRQRTGAEEKD